MPKYMINAYREIYYSFEVEADNVDNAIEQMRTIELTENVEDYAYDWYPLELDEVNELETK
jgi:hypothetical protein